MHQEFTPLEYLYIDIANCYGWDKETWEDRIKWVMDHEEDLESMTENADDIPLHAKAVHALRETQAGNATGHLMGLDATASGLQLMAALIGCHTTARAVNLIDTGSREDVYQMVAHKMSALPGISVDRKKVKKPIMTTLYGSTAQPEHVFGEDTPELDAFYDTLDKALPGAVELLEDMLYCQDNSKNLFTWTMPDGHVVNYKTYIPKDYTFRIPSLGDVSYTYRHYVNEPDQDNKSIAANIVHSVDGYVVREMLRRLNAEGIEMLPIHDAFYAHPCDMNRVRYHYKEILADIADSDLMRNIFRELFDNPRLSFKKHTNNLSTQIRESNYALS